MWYRSNLLARLMNSSPNSERTRLARELHDGLAQELAAFGYRLDQVIGDENLGNSNRATLRELRLSLTSVINQVRDEIYELRSNKSKEFAQQLTEQIDTLLASSEIAFEIDGQINVKAENKFELLRAIKELVLNAKRHSNCSIISIQLTNTLITIKDNGQGGVTKKNNSYGIDGVKERLNLIGLSMQIDSNSSGTTITIAI
jgi:NarL family two-component system sensor histidine kinase LiaS